MIFFIIVMVCFAYTGFTIYKYLTASFQLLEHLQASAPDIWQRLGSPRKIWVQNTTPGKGGGIYTIKPLWPWLNWIWQADSNGLDYRLGKELLQVSRLLKSGLIGLAITIIAFGILMVTSTPA